jgi:hypothetical protein
LAKDIQGQSDHGEGLEWKDTVLQVTGSLVLGGGDPPFASFPHQEKNDTGAVCCLS